MVITMWGVLIYLSQYVMWLNPPSADLSVAHKKE
jgi:hypothetical protein